MRRRLFLLCIFAACTRSEDTSVTQTAETARMGGVFPAVLVYKTKANFNDLVPLELSRDKKTIVSYPDPIDVIGHKPVFLHKGYLLDRRGIGENVAFLRFTYEEYASLRAVPPMKTLYDAIIENDPLTELYDCGPSINFKHSATQINQIIDANHLQTTCRRLK